MRQLPLTIGTLHFVGIGGIGMSGIAEVLHNLGYKVQGSDIAESVNVHRLRRLGIPVAIGHRAENLGEAAVLVVSSAIRPDNPELMAARDALIPVVRRAEMLAEIMRLRWSVAVAGTHGKTTTTSMVAAVLEAGGFDPTVINGGIINAYGTNTRLGTGDWLVAEADESDGSFVKLPALIAVITNIDAEHLDHFGSFEAIKQSFRRFVENIPFYGFAVLCLDHPEVQALIPQLEDRRILTYGFGPQADVRAVDVELTADGSRFALELSDRMGARRIDRLELGAVGRHNVQNALAACTIALEMQVPDEVIGQGLARFAGVKRRFTRTGSWNGIGIVDDYGHHPVEIAAVLATARVVAQGRVIAVVQPHRYSRLASLFDQFCTCMNDADVVLVADVYAAGESPIEGFDRDGLVQGLRRHGHRGAIAMTDPALLPRMVAEIARPGDLVVCLGAGSITHWANALPGQLEALDAAPAGRAR